MDVELSVCAQVEAIVFVLVFVFVVAFVLYFFHIICDVGSAEIMMTSCQPASPERLLLCALPANAIECLRLIGMPCVATCTE